LVAAVEINVVANAPDCVKLPAVENVVPFANVKVALVTGCVNVMLLIVLPVNASVPAKVANVPATVGNVIVVATVLLPIKIIFPLVATVVWSPIVNVALLVGCVNVILLILVAVATPRIGVVSVGAVNVLFDSVSEPANVANVPVVGKVTLVAAVEVNVVAKAPDCVKLPAVENVVWSPIVKVALFVGCVNVILFTLVAVATPRVGVVIVGAVNVLFVSVSVPVIVEYP